VADKFQQDHPEATVILYSAWALFCKVLNNPELYGFELEDVKPYSPMWTDHVHPTSAMHEIIGVDLSEYLSECQAYR
jgi:phospholipase/lecithinase/hemolysin